MSACPPPVLKRALNVATQHQKDTPCTQQFAASPSLRQHHAPRSRCAHACLAPPAASKRKVASTHTTPLHTCHTTPCAHASSTQTSVHASGCGAHTILDNTESRISPFPFPTVSHTSTPRRASAVCTVSSQYPAPPAPPSHARHQPRHCPRGEACPLMNPRTGALQRDAGKAKG